MARHADLYRPRSRRGDAEPERLEDAIERAEKDAKDVLLLSHGHCLDGTASAIVTLRALGEDRVGLAYIQPSDVARALDLLGNRTGKKRTLMLADLSFNPDHYDRVLKSVRRLARRGWRVEWRDHHEKQWEGLDLDAMSEHLAVLDVNQDHTESGASLQQEALAPRDPFARRLAAAVRDRDLWLNETPDGETLEYAITWMGEDDFTKHMLARGPKDRVVDVTILRAAESQRALVEEHTRILLDDARYYPTRSGDQVGVVFGWLPKNVGLHRLLEQDHVRVAINVRPNGKMSIRSRKDAPVSHLVARRFDGGGHASASGADLGLTGLAYLWYVLRRGRVARTEEVATAAVQALESYDDAETS